MTKYEDIPQHFIVDNQLWETILDSDPEVISRNCEIFFDRKDGFYRIPMLDEVYEVYPQDKKIVRQIEEKFPEEKYRVELTLFLLHYLLGTTDVPLAGKRVSEKELKGGEMFFRGPHALPTRGIIKKFGKNPKGLIDTGLNLRGSKIDLGDASIELRAAPKIPVTYVLWAEDEEFPASVTILFDPTIQEFLPLDIIYGVTILTSYRLVDG